LKSTFIKVFILICFKSISELCCSFSIS
jgi:hypothetical protein